MQLNELEIYLNQLLDAAHFCDYCPNGLQVEGRNEIRQLVSGVTASFDFLQAAVEAGADAVLVHHGYFWRGESECLVGMKRRMARPEGATKPAVGWRLVCARGAGLRLAGVLHTMRQLA